MKYVECGAAEAIRKLPCFACGGPGPCDAAHVLSRGAGEVTVRENLVPLHRACHTVSHYSGTPSYLDMLWEAARREGLDANKIERAVWRIRNLPKDATREAEAILLALRGPHGDHHRHAAADPDLPDHAAGVGDRPSGDPADENGWVEF